MITAVGTAGPEWGSEAHIARVRALDAATGRHETTMANVMRDYFRAQRHAVLARVNGTAKRYAVKADDPVPEPFSRAEWNRRLARTATPVLAGTFRDGGALALDELGLQVTFDVQSPEAEQWLATKVQTFARQINDATWEELRASLRDGLAAGDGVPALMDRVRTIFTSYETYRTEAIARTEVIGASNAGQLIAAQQTNEVESKTWLAALDSRTRLDHRNAHGQTVLLDELFTLVDAAGNKYTGPAPHQFSSAKEVVNCRCTMTFNLKSSGTQPPEPRRRPRR